MWCRLPRDPSQGPRRDPTPRLRPVAWTPGAFLPLNHPQPLAAARPSARADSERSTPLAKSTAALDQDRKLIQLARDGSLETHVIEHGKQALAHYRAAQRHIEGTRN